MTAPTFHTIAKTMLQDEAEVIQLEINPSGVQPVEYKVMVRLDPPEEVTKSGIVLSTGDETEREAFAVVKGTLVAVGHKAFSDWPRDGRPSIGARVMIAKHEGIMVRGADQEPTERPTYRLLHDKQVAGVIFKERDDHDPMMRP